MVFYQWKRIVEMMEQYAPFFVSLGVTKPDSMILRTIPFYQQQLTIRGLDTPHRA